MPARPATAITTIVSMIVLIVGVFPSSAAPPAPRPLPEELQRQLLRRVPVASAAQAVRQGVVARDLASEVRRSGSADGFLILDGDQALQAAANGAPSGPSRADLILSVTRPAYAAQKSDVLGRLSGVRVIQDYDNLPVVFVRFASEGALVGAANDPEVVGIGADRVLQTTLSESLPLIRQPQAAADGFIGSGASVAVLDTGVLFTHPAFGSCTSPGVPAECRVVVAQDFAANDGSMDDDGHGTNVAATVLGVAPSANILALDVFEANGSASLSVLINALNFTIGNQAAFNVRAVNMSLGVPRDYNTLPCGDPSNPLVSVFSNMRGVNIIPVIAAGNYAFMGGVFQNGISFPACTPGAISVGAVYDSPQGGFTWGIPPDTCTDGFSAADQITCFSQSADFLTVLAPGAFITAAGITQGGTSQATPHVAGAVAVLSAASPPSTSAISPSATLDQITSAIAGSGPAILDSRNGVSKHRFDLPDAVSAVGGTPSPSPSASPSPTGTPPPAACTIIGTSGSEVLTGTPGDDVICGSGGDDLLIPGGGNDTVIGGLGFDWISLEDAPGPVTVDLGLGTASGAAGDKRMQGVEGVLGSQFDDMLRGTSGANDLFGLGGDDLLLGLDGFDHVRYDFSSSGVTVDIAGDLAQGEGIDTLGGINAVVGSAGSDRLLGDRKANELYGFKGDDVLEGRRGDDILVGNQGNDHLAGGKGNDDLFGGPGADVCKQGAGVGLARFC